jgi:Zn-dependent protease/CBS domain-containing protein
MGGRGSLTIFSVRGIPVRLHYTFLLVLPYLAWVIGKAAPLLAQLADVPPDDLVVPRYLMGALLGVALFACVLVHEFAHVFVGMRGGARFSGVTLMLVGGVSEVVELPRKPLQEAAMAVAGPLASAVIAGACLLGFLAGGPSDLRFAFHYLGYVNLALAIFNLIPAFPMDGGRVLRALLALVTSRVWATRLASWIGQGMALLFLAGAVYTANWVLGLIGLMVIFGARAEFASVRASEEMGGLTVREAMHHFPPTVDSNDRMGGIVDRMERELRTVFFVLARGDYVGAVTLAEARRYKHSAELAFATAGEAMRRDLPRLTPGQDLSMATRILSSTEANLLPVVDGQVLVGCLSLAEVARALRVRRDEQQGRTALQEREAT